MPNGTRRRHNDEPGRDNRASLGRSSNKLDDMAKLMIQDGIGRKKKNNFYLVFLPLAVLFIPLDSLSQHDAHGIHKARIG